MSIDSEARKVAAQALAVAQAGMTSISALSSGAVVTSAYTAAPGDVIDADTSAGTWTLTLPASGGSVAVRDNAGTWGTNPLIVSGNGALFAIDGDEAFTLDASGFQVTFTMINSAWYFTLAFLNGAA